MRARTRSIIAAGLLGVAGISGGAAIASAQTPTAAVAQQDKHENDLAAKLGVSADQLKEAMKKVHENKGSQTDRSQALADALGIDKAKVDAAFQDIQASHKADMRTKLSEQLDASVAAGKLTAADKESVLKAFDADALMPKHEGMGPRGGHQFGGHHGKGGQQHGQDSQQQDSQKSQQG